VSTGEICNDVVRNGEMRHIRLPEFEPMACLQRDYLWTREIS